MEFGNWRRLRWMEVAIVLTYAVASLGWSHLHASDFSGLVAESFAAGCIAAAVGVLADRSDFAARGAVVAGAVWFVGSGGLTVLLQFVFAFPFGLALAGVAAGLAGWCVAFVWVMRDR